LTRHTVSAYSKAEFHWKDFCWPYIDTESACQKPSNAPRVEMLCKQISILLSALLLCSGLVLQHLGSLLWQSVSKKRRDSWRRTGENVGNWYAVIIRNSPVW
jgi:hypothetical protein